MSEDACGLSDGAPSAAEAAAVSGSKMDYVQQRYATKEDFVHFTKEQTEKMLDQVLQSNETVKYLLESMKMGGCGVGRSFFKVVECNAEIHGGFNTEEGVLLCYNKLKHYKDLECAVAHELVHAYDYCRVKGLDLRNCHHHACTEIRAANLSGDCRFLQELFRGNIGSTFIGQQMRCVKRRAAMSVSMNPFCKGVAEQAVNDMMPACFSDTDPFPKVPNL